MADYTAFDMITDMIGKATGVPVSFIPNTRENLSSYDSLLSAGLSQVNSCNFEEEKLYCIEDLLHVHTLILRRKLPDDLLMIIGSFLTAEPGDEEIIRVMSANAMHPSTKPALIDYYRSLPLAKLSYVRYFAGIAGRFLYGRTVKFDMINLSLSPLSSGSITPFQENPGAQLTFFKEVEKLFDLEKKMMWEIEHGNRKEALQTYEELYLYVKKRLHREKQLQTARCHSHSLNVLCRKSAQYSGVHVSLLHEASEHHTIRIEQAMSPGELHDGDIRMLGEYLTLVQNLSMKEYSKSIRQVTAFILTNLGAEIKLGTLAELCSLSPTYLAALFKKETGMTVGQFITIRRIQLASDLLIQSGMQIQEIALYLGFQDTSYFSRVFRKETGMTPQAFRRKHKIIR